MDRQRLIRSSLLLTVSILIITLVSCKDDPVAPPPSLNPQDTINISVTDFTSSSITIDIHTTANNSNSNIRLYRLLNSAETLISEFPILVKDTVIKDDDNGAGLERNTSYTYYAIRIDTSGARKDSSNIVEASTFDTTAHSRYTWQEYTFGNAPSNDIRDVWGTNENDVWAVGGVRIDTKFYGGFHWDGNTWLLDSTVGGSAIYGFSSDDIWAVGGGVFHYNGSGWERVDGKTVGGGSVPLDTVLYENSPYRAVWGISSNNLYLGGDNGKVIHWNGTKGNVILDMIDPINDIYGSSQDNIWVLARDISIGEHPISHFNGIEWINTTLPNDLVPITIFTTSEDTVFIGGNSVYYKNGMEWTDFGISEIGAFYALRGISSNDLFAVGSWGKVYHYNGFNWKKYEDLVSDVTYTGIYQFGSKVFITGRSSDQKGKIVIGTRQ